MSSANLKVSLIFNATTSLVITSPMVSHLILSVAESIDHSPSTLLGGFNLHHGNRLDDSIAAAGGTFACFLNALVVLGKRPNLFEGFCHASRIEIRKLAFLYAEGAEVMPRSCASDAAFELMFDAPGGRSLAEPRKNACCGWRHCEFFYVATGAAFTV